MSTPKPAQLSAGAKFRAAIAAEKPLQVVGAINAYAARMAEATGFRALYLSGGGVAANSLGLPDLGISTMDDVLIDIRRITEASTLPLLVDADTGWGGAFNIASVGLAGGAELKTTVMPFILRGVNLLGINSSATPRSERLEVWRRISTDLAPRHLSRIAQRTIAFAELPGAFQAYLDGKVIGRTVVKIT
jgi:hypothetical protein